MISCLVIPFNFDLEQDFLRKLIDPLLLVRYPYNKENQNDILVCLLFLEQYIECVLDPHI